MMSRRPTPSCGGRRRAGQLAAHQRDAPGPAAAPRAQRRRPHAQPARRARHARPLRRPAVGELAGHREGQAAVDDPHRRLPRGAGLVTRRPHDTDGRQVVVDLTARARGVLDEDRRRRDAWLAQRLADLDRRRARAAARASPRCSTGWPVERMRSDVRRPARPQLPAVRRRVAAVQHRHLDAARRPGLAGPRPHRQRRRARHHDRPAVPADRCCSRRSPASSPTATRSGRCSTVTQAIMGVTAARARACSPSPGRSSRGTSTSSPSCSAPAGAFDTPARQAFVNEMVDRDHLANAVGLNSASFNLARMIGPALAGVLIALLGSGVARHRLGDPAQRGQLRRRRSSRCRGCATSELRPTDAAAAGQGPAPRRHALRAVAPRHHARHGRSCSAPARSGSTSR